MALIFSTLSKFVFPLAQLKCLIFFFGFVFAANVNFSSACFILILTSCRAHTDSAQYIIGVGFSAAPSDAILGFIFFNEKHAFMNWWYLGGL